jgi:2-amino-4-hydroxy-6-hydroxymethyldihydropteridine diphosphokinase
MRQIEHQVTTAYIGFGANLGQREQTWQIATQHISALRDSKLIERSPLYETAPIGGPPQSAYLNGVIAVQTLLPAQELLTQLLEIERDLGRTRTVHWGPRTIDLDLLLFGSSIIDLPGPPALQIPHPRLHLRRFALVPLADIAPQVTHPIARKNIQQLLHACLDRADVIPYTRVENISLIQHTRI